MLDHLFDKVQKLLPDNFSLVKGHDGNGDQLYLWRNDKPEDAVSLLLPYATMRIRNGTFDSIDEKEFVAMCKSTIQYMQGRS